MRRFLVMIAAMIGIGMMMASVPAKAASMSLLPDATIEQMDTGKSLTTNVTYKKWYCHWHKKCRLVYTCWWRGGYKHCGWKKVCSRWCHKHWKNYGGVYFRAPHVGVRVYY